MRHWNVFPREVVDEGLISGGAQDRLMELWYLKIGLVEAVPEHKITSKGAFQNTPFHDPYPLMEKTNNPPPQKNPKPKNKTQSNSMYYKCDLRDLLYCYKKFILLLWKSQYKMENFDQYHLKTRLQK